MYSIWYNALKYNKIKGETFMQTNINNNIAQDKVLILYLLENLESDITEGDLYKLISSINDMNYFYFKQILADLIDSKLVGSYTREEEKETPVVLYEITTEGKDSLNLTIEILPGIVKLKADTVLKNDFQNIANESSIITEYVPENENSYTVKCKIVENNITIFEIRTFAGSNEQAKVISENWKKNAYSIYPQILKIITGNNL